MLSRSLKFACATWLAAAASGASAQPALSWTTLSDGSRITAIDEGRGQLRRYRCLELPPIGTVCLMMESFSTFGTLYVFGVSGLPASAVQPSSGFRCSIEPGSSFSQELYTTEAGSRAKVLGNHQAYPGRSLYRRDPVWSSEIVRSLASDNAISLSSVFFECADAYQLATRLGGIRALFTPQYPFPVRARTR